MTWEHSCADNNRVACTVRQVDKRQDVKIVMRAVDYAGDSWLLGLTFDHRLPLGALALVGMASGQDIITVVSFDRHGKFVLLSQETDNRTAVPAAGN